MQIIKLSDEQRDPENVTSLAMGMFDGLHIGHMRLIDRAVKLASVEKFRGHKGCGVYTFDVHPKSVFVPEASPKFITMHDRKFSLLEERGVDFVFVQEFNVGVAAMEPDRFVKDILVDKINPKYIVVGYNYTFGRNGSGDANTLSELCRGYGIAVEVIPQVSVNGVVVSSTKVREAIVSGDVQMANMLLGRNYRIKARPDFGLRPTQMEADEKGRVEIALSINPKIMIPGPGTYVVKTGAGGRSSDRRVMCIINDDSSNDRHVKLCLPPDCVREIEGADEIEMTFLDKVDVN